MGVPNPVDVWAIINLYILSEQLGSTSLGSASSIQAAVRQLEAEADAIIQMVREGQRARRLQQAPPPTVSSASAAVAAAAAAAAAGSSVVVPHAPTGAAPPAGTAAAATVSMGCTDSRHTPTHTQQTVQGEMKKNIYLLLYLL